MASSTSDASVPPLTGWMAKRTAKLDRHTSWRDSARNSRTYVMGETTDVLVDTAQLVSIEEHDGTTYFRMRVKSVDPTFPRWDVLRRFNDFKRLRENLGVTDQRVGSVFPPKTGFFVCKGGEIHQRKFVLQNWIKGLIAEFKSGGDGRNALIPMFRASKLKSFHKFFGVGLDGSLLPTCAHVQETAAQAEEATSAAIPVAQAQAATNPSLPIAQGRVVAVQPNSQGVISALQPSGQAHLGSDIKSAVDDTVAALGRTVGSLQPAPTLPAAPIQGRVVSVEPVPVAVGSAAPVIPVGSVVSAAPDIPMASVVYVGPAPAIPMGRVISVGPAPALRVVAVETLPSAPRELVAAWSCSACTLENPTDCGSCDACGQARTLDAVAVAAVEAPIESSERAASKEEQDKVVDYEPFLPAESIAPIEEIVSSEPEELETPAADDAVAAPPAPIDAASEVEPEVEAPPPARTMPPVVDINAAVALQSQGAALEASGQREEAVQVYRNCVKVFEFIVKHKEKNPRIVQMLEARIADITRRADSLWEEVARSALAETKVEVEPPIESGYIVVDAPAAPVAASTVEVAAVGPTPAMPEAA